ncbi:helix-hairpin-helix DNA-binding motif-containing protein [Cupriavidus basilensis OR16]|uniref:Helix-hairpin-helix DNA-binding motif-containing protein n=1 Tax=Cupriavidus basilensis OR16 TaxID=1127483 RepID=H1S9H5_9BURK|nr:helix-turn-helix transcriptional regulator [Cupriavidus basilensis]EHP40899.1 helix-hairpin-helix DNA-binding motif-containing protein [Cupriavidus basilensis OR16]
MKQLLTTSSQLGQVLQSARRAAKLSQTDLAARLDVSQSRISHMELNPGSISADQLLALVSVLGLELVVQDKRTAGAEASPVEW